VPSASTAAVQAKALGRGQRGRAVEAREQAESAEQGGGHDKATQHRERGRAVLLGPPTGGLAALHHVDQVVHQGRRRQVVSGDQVQAHAVDEVGVPERHGRVEDAAQRRGQVHLADVLRLVQQVEQLGDEQGHGLVSG
jgi:hypothetical protein